ncbi:AtuA-related protein [Castellaniella caeni]|uniref:AtuA-related protein n=1 Tax=Castellaniella caeni TaxID=266123 RepID=UPI00082F42FD|nr:hypothetical protein [Castellaniella caeni]
MKLRQLAHARTGDKGDTSNISVIAYRHDDYERLCAALSAARVQAYLAGLFEAGDVPPGFQVRRYELPGVAALNFVVTGVLRGGVTRSLALDAHGKTLGSILLDLDV